MGWIKENINSQINKHEFNVENYAKYDCIATAKETDDEILIDFNKYS